MEMATRKLMEPCEMAVGFEKNDVGLGAADGL